MSTFLRGVVDWGTFHIEWIWHVGGPTERGEFEERFRRAANGRCTFGLTEIKGLGRNPRASLDDRRNRQYFDLANRPRQAILTNLEPARIHLAPATGLRAPDLSRLAAAGRQHRQRVVGETCRADRSNEAGSRSQSSPNAGEGARPTGDHDLTHRIGRDTGVLDQQIDGC
jgi:hypothetical protein